MFTGTGTEVGKTWVAAAALVALRSAGWVVTARKPLQSFNADDETTDAAELAEASGEPTELVCPPSRSYPVPLAPPMAAAELGLDVPDRSEVLRELDRSWPDPPADIGIVEGAGGVASPLTSDGDTADLARALGADLVVVVGPPVLGAINNVRLARRALDPLPVVVHLNRFDPLRRLHRLNLEWLSEREGLTVTTDIHSLTRAIAGLAEG